MQNESAAAALAFLVVLSGCRNVTSVADSQYEIITEQVSDSSEDPAATVHSITGWKPYEHPKYRFKFDYPSNWFVQVEEHTREADDTLACDSITVRVSNFEWHDGPWQFPAEDSTLVFVSAIKGCSDSPARMAFEQQHKNAELGGKPAVQSLTKQEQTDAGPLVREETGITLQAFNGETEYLVGIRPLDTPFDIPLKRVFSSFRFLD
jgi:ABC-type uncharacterized transport system auxiliary subunit